MKLFLSSLAVSADHLPQFVELVGKDPKQTKLGLIENAADVEAGPKPWVEEHRKTLQDHGFQIESIDLTTFTDGQPGLKDKLADQDVIWIGGGNTYYLRYLLSKTGADLIITELVNKGTVYGGGSAGAIVAGPTLNHFQAADDPKLSPELILTGLELTDVVIVPHMDSEKFAPIIGGINQALIDAGYNTAPLKDNEALVIDGPRHHRI
jgi:dipeptidase E